MNGAAQNLPVGQDMARLRTRMERAIQRLIDALDAMDAADEDLEPSGDELEPVLGAAEGLFGWKEDAGNTLVADGCEWDVADAPHDPDWETGLGDADGMREQMQETEPDLGSRDAVMDQLLWSYGDDGEDCTPGCGPMPIRKLGSAGTEGVGEPCATAFIAAGRNRLRLVRHAHSCVLSAPSAPAL